MPQRWERDLERLGSIRAPAATRTRIETGPRGITGPGRPGRRQRFVAGAVAFAVFGGALAFAAYAFGDRRVPTAADAGVNAVQFVFNAPPEGELPSAFMGVGLTGQAVRGELPFAEWPLVEVDLDKPKLEDFHEVPAGAPIVISGTAISVDGWVDSCCDGSLPPPHLSSLDLAAGASIPHEPGRFVLEFSAHWAEGSQTFLFPIEAVVPGAPPSNSAVLTLMANEKPTASLTYEGQEAPVAVGSYCWKNGGSVLCSEGGYNLVPFAHDQFLSVPVGTDLSVGGDGAIGSIVLAPGNDPTQRPVSLFRIETSFKADIGRYVLHVEASWSQGDVDFYFPVELTPVGTPPSSSAPEAGGTSPASSPVPTVTPSAIVEVPDIVGLGDQDAFMKLVHEDFKVEALFRDVPGDTWHVVSSDPSAGTEVVVGSTITVTVVSHITPLPEDSLDELSCSPAERVAFGSPHMMITPAGEAWIAGNTGGVLGSDAVEPVDQAVSEGLWRVVRGGEVVALIDYGTLDGVACAGSGVAGA